MITRNMDGHFSELAAEYNELRLTDLEPVLYIRDRLASLRPLHAVDVGCGAGRYDLLFFQQLKNLHLTCIDSNASMLEETSRFLTSQGIKDFSIIRSGAEDIPLDSDSVDAVFTFNAVHHFDFLRFLKDAARITKKSGFVFIYTRLHSQNSGSIWGKYFPFFLEKEKRLYEMDEMKGKIRSAGALRMEDVKYFRYRRIASIEELLKRVESRHYSTFSLYSDDELQESSRKFKENILQGCLDPGHIEWTDENIMLVLRPDSD